MTLPDFTSLTQEELKQALEQISALYRQREADKKDQREQRRAEVAAAVSALEALLGPEDSAPYDPVTGANATINGVLKHDTEDHQVLAQNAGLCLSLILHGMKVDVTTGLNLARLAATEG